MLSIYHTLIANPLLNILVGLYETVALEDLGVAIIILTILVRLAFYPLFQKGLEQQAKMQELQPKIKELQAKHKGDHAAHSRALLDLYKEHNFNPFSSVLMLLIQIPILIALYHLFLSIFSPDVLSRLYAFVPNPGALNQTAFGFLNLTESYFTLVAVTALLQFVQARMAMRGVKFNDKAQQMTSQVLVFVAPVITLVIFATLPAAVTLYWLVSSLLSVGQQYLVSYRRANAEATS
jgi:YidC/Oxa1 family membrane protein insertase